MLADAQTDGLIAILHTPSGGRGKNKISGGMVSSRPRKCRYVKPSHTIPLPALNISGVAVVGRASSNVSAQCFLAPVTYDERIIDTLLFCHVGLRCCARTGERET